MLKSTQLSSFWHIPSLCKHSLCLVPSNFHLPERKPLAVPPAPTPAPGKQQAALCRCGFACARQPMSADSYTCGLPWPASFTDREVCELRPRRGVCRCRATRRRVCRTTFCLPQLRLGSGSPWEAGQASPSANPVPRPCLAASLCTQYLTAAWTAAASGP